MSPTLGVEVPESLDKAPTIGFVPAVEVEFTYCPRAGVDGYRSEN